MVKCGNIDKSHIKEKEPHIEHEKIPWINKQMWNSQLDSVWWSGIRFTVRGLILRVEDRVNKPAPKYICEENSVFDQNWIQCAWIYSECCGSNCTSKSWGNKNMLPKSWAALHYLECHTFPYDNKDKQSTFEILWKLRLKLYERKSQRKKC